MRRAAFTFALLAIVVLPASAQGASWAKPQIRAVVASGLMGPSVAKFRPNAPLTRRALGKILAGITHEAQVVEDPDRAVTMTELNRALVKALGLAPAARHVRSELRAAELRPPDRAGFEVVARLLRLRYNHPTGTDERELRPADDATRAETAYSVAQVLDLDSWELEYANSTAARDQPAEPDGLDEEGAPACGRLHRLPLRLGRNVGEHADALRRDVARGLRLLRFRLARLQDRALRRRAAPRHDDPRAHDLRHER